MVACEEQPPLPLHPSTFTTTSSSPHPGSVNTQRNLLRRGWEKGGSQEGERPDPVAQAADPGGLRQLVATRLVGAGIPSLVHSLCRALDRPGPSRLSSADLTHMSHTCMAAGSSWRRSWRSLRAGHSPKDGLPDSELVPAATGARDGPEGAKHPHSKGTPGNPPAVQAERLVNTREVIGRAAQGEDQS